MYIPTRINTERVLCIILVPIGNQYELCCNPYRHIACRQPDPWVARSYLGTMEVLTWKDSIAFRSFFRFINTTLPHVESKTSLLAVP